MARFVMRCFFVNERSLVSFSEVDRKREDRRDGIYLVLYFRSDFKSVCLSPASSACWAIFNGPKTHSPEFPWPRVNTSGFVKKSSRREQHVECFDFKSIEWVCKQPWDVSTQRTLQFSSVKCIRLFRAPYNIPFPCMNKATFNAAHYLQNIGAPDLIAVNSCGLVGKMTSIVLCKFHVLDCWQQQVYTQWQWLT